MSRRTKTSMAPLAVTSAGEILINAAYALGTGDETLDDLVGMIGPRAKVFLGVVVSGKAVPEVLRRIDDAAAEIVGTIGVSAIGVRRGKASVPASAQRSSGPSRGPRDSRARRR